MRLLERKFKMKITIKKLKKGRIELTNESCLSAYGLPVVRHDGDCDCDCNDKLYADMMCPQVAKNTRVFDYVKQIAFKTKNRKIYDACILFLKASPEFDSKLKMELIELEIGNVVKQIRGQRFYCQIIKGNKNCGHKHQTRTAAEKCLEKLLCWDSSHTHCSSEWYGAHIQYYNYNNQPRDLESKEITKEFEKEQ